MATREFMVVPLEPPPATHLTRDADHTCSLLSYATKNSTLSGSVITILPTRLHYAISSFQFLSSLSKGLLTNSPTPIWLYEPPSFIDPFPKKVPLFFSKVLLSLWAILLPTLQPPFDSSHSELFGRRRFLERWKFYFVFLFEKSRIHRIEYKNKLPNYSISPSWCIMSKRHLENHFHLFLRMSYCCCSLV